MPTLAADSVPHDHSRPPFWGVPGRRIQLPETAVQSPKASRTKAPNRTQRVIRRNALLRQNVRKHCPLVQKFARIAAPQIRNAEMESFRHRCRLNFCRGFEAVALHFPDLTTAASRPRTGAMGSHGSPPKMAPQRLTGWVWGPPDLSNSSNARANCKGLP